MNHKHNRGTGNQRMYCINCTHIYLIWFLFFLSISSLVYFVCLELSSRFQAYKYPTGKSEKHRYGLIYECVCLCMCRLSLNKSECTLLTHAHLLVSLN